jgi:hypothetical protein
MLLTQSPRLRAKGFCGYDGFSNDGVCGQPSQGPYHESPSATNDSLGLKLGVDKVLGRGHINRMLYRISISFVDIVSR